MRKTEIFAIILTLLSVVAAAVLYKYMPAEMASHWNAAGEVDDYMNKFWALALLPIAFAVFTLMLIFIPRIDPLKKNVKTFLPYFDGFIIIMYLFFILIFGQMIAWNFGYEISYTYTMPVAFGVLLYYIGIMLKKAKRNWFIGIRTPWTLSSDKVWDKTHDLGGNLYKIMGLIALFGVFVPKLSIWLILVPVLVSTAYIIVYSYFEFKKLK